MTTTFNGAVLASFLGLALLVPGFGAGAAELDTSSIEVTVAKTRSKVIVYGETAGPRAGQRLFLRLRRTTSDGVSETVARTRAVAVEGKGGLVTYRATFERPLEGTCDVRVRFAGNEDHTSAQARKEFPCANPKFGTGQVVLTDGAASKVIDGLIADTQELQSYGLMYRKHLAEEKGMIFAWEEDVHYGFYMKNTLIPLSIAFIDTNGIVQEILEMEPCSGDPCPNYTPAQPYRGALEVNQGMFAEWGIEAGDLITYTRD